MKINEVEARLQISKANIRFYEKEGLLSPKRGENGYRDYCEKDMEQLKKIIILRKLGVTIPDMRELFAGQIELQDVLATNMEQLTRQLAEIHGAIRLCEEMQKDDQAAVHLTDDFYWNRLHEEQTQGARFVDIVNDYLEFEKQSWLAMWCGPFLFPADKLVKKKGWLITIVVLLLLCVVRGMVKAIWHTGTFVEGFGYPFVLFAFMTLITFPLFVLNRRYRDADLPEPKQLKAWQKVLKVIGALLYLPVVFFGGLLVSDRCITSALLGDFPYVTTSKLWLLYFIVGMYLFCVIVWLYGRHGIFGRLGEGMEGFRAHLPGRVKTKVLLLSIGAYLLVLVLYSLCFTAFTEDGVIDRTLWHTKTYTWEDVDHYELRAGFDGCLNYTVVMQDGFRASCLGSGISGSSLPEDRYPDDTDSYAKMLTEKFHDMHIPLKACDWEKLKKKLTYEYWRDYADELREIVE